MNKNTYIKPKDTQDYFLVFLATIPPLAGIGIELRICILVSLHIVQWSQRISEGELKYLFSVILLENIL